MADNDWHEVTRKKQRSVFQRLKFPNSSHSMSDELAKISLSVYVSNFPSHLSVRELWNIYGKAGTLVDVYIAKHRNALGQMFGFCRFIKVSNQESLINSLSNVWIARGSTNINSKSPNFVHEDAGINNPSIIVSQDKPNEFPFALLGCYKDFRAIANTRSMCRNEGFLDVDFKYLGCLWVLFDFGSSDARDKFLNHKGVSTWFTILKPWHDDFVVEERLIWLEVEGVPIRAWDNQVFNQICNKWGEVLFIDDSDVSNRLSKRLCIKSTHANLIFVSILVTLNNVTYTIRVRELCSWTPTFVASDNDSDEENSVGKYDKSRDESIEDNDIGSDVDSLANINIPELAQEQEDEVKVQDNTFCVSPKPNGSYEKPLDSDPFELDHLINKSDKIRKLCQSVTPKYPPGFSSILKGDHVTSDSFHSLNDSVKKPGFSMIERLEETIKVGHALGINMEGCEETLASLIAEKGEKLVNK
ncbi:hypothetical protein CTI12_AA008630 [Artemisia annua]|uniref:RRM domain-containing protein n=1 Tax=Artemisia annua TaxID=35608 RepID=A0A2U1QBT8_ARTAN|nr:hypothetical protein CTI12_AA008630 [Artemisia annua]